MRRASVMAVFSFAGRQAAMSSVIAAPIAPLDPVAEASVRRGYRAGFLVAILTVAGILHRDVHDALYEHADSGPLAAWAETDEITDQAPPPSVRIGDATSGSHRCALPT
jgi:hypothetical protein